jgi:tetratricopeptide (TPR) repeat protein
MGRYETYDSLLKEFARAYPGNPLMLVGPSRLAAARGDFDRAAQLSADILPKIASSRTTMAQQRNIDALLAMTRGKVRESLQIRVEQRGLQVQLGLSNARLDALLDSVSATGVVLEDPARARALLDRGLRRVPIDSIPYLDRNYDILMWVAATLKDTARAREWHAESRRSWEAFGKTIDRPAWEAYDDAMLAMAFGRHAEALAGLQEADRLRLGRIDILAAAKFAVLDRMEMADSAIATGEYYLTVTHFQRIGQDALYRAGILQRLGEMYEAKGNFDKALTHYQAFVDLWKDADAELQPRVRDVRGRIERLQRRRG